MGPVTNIEKAYIRKAGNQGLVATTAGNDLLHLMPLATVAAQTGARSAQLVKIMAYNAGANATLQFGTLNRNPGGAAFVQLLPTLLAVGGFDNEWTEDEIPFVEWMSWPALTAAGRTGDIYVVASVAGILVSIEIKEFGG